MKLSISIVAFYRLLLLLFNLPEIENLPSSNVTPQITLENPSEASQSQSLQLLTGEEHNNAAVPQSMYKLRGGSMPKNSLAVQQTIDSDLLNSFSLSSPTSDLKLLNTNKSETLESKSNVTTLKNDSNSIPLTSKQKLNNSIQFNSTLNTKRHKPSTKYFLYPSNPSQNPIKRQKSLDNISSVTSVNSQEQEPNEVGVEDRNEKDENIETALKESVKQRETSIGVGTGTGLKVNVPPTIVAIVATENKEDSIQKGNPPLPSKPDTLATDSSININNKKSTFNTSPSDNQSKNMTLSTLHNSNVGSGLLTSSPRTIVNDPQQGAPLKSDATNVDGKTPSSSNVDTSNVKPPNSLPGTSNGVKIPPQPITKPSDPNTATNNFPSPVDSEKREEQHKQASAQLSTSSPKSASNPGQGLGLGEDGGEDYSQETSGLSGQDNNNNNNNGDGMEDFDSPKVAKGEVNNEPTTTKKQLTASQVDNAFRANDYKETFKNSFEASRSDSNLNDVGVFSYFLTFVVICGVGFFMLHHRKRIIAIVLEGRRPRGGRTRRSSSGSYRKLENNFD